MGARLRIIVKAATFVALAATLAGCNLLPVRTVHDYCQLAHPLRVCESDQMCDPLAKDILAHNETGERVCGKKWK